MTTRLLLLLNMGCAVALGITIYFTRATLRRAASAVAAAVVVTLLSVPGDVFAYSIGWWRDTFGGTTHSPVLIYTAVVLKYGATAALIGWRITRRFGWRGQVAFLTTMMIYGPIHGYLVADWTGLWLFASWTRSVIPIAVCWGIGTAAIQGIMRIIGGPASSDALARRQPAT